MQDSRVRRCLNAEQIDIHFDSSQYSAFPHLIRLDGDELLIAFRQAPRRPQGIRHTHMRSIITVMRSYNLGRTWDAENATQLAAGGGQEFAPIRLSGGRIGGALAWHHVAPEHEGDRAGIARKHAGEYPFASAGPLWARSDNLGFTWRPDQISPIGEQGMPCGAPIRTHDGALLCPVYTFQEDAQARGSVLYRSADEGLTWSRPTVMAVDQMIGDFCEPSIVEVAPGRLRAMHRIENTKIGGRGYFWTNESHDGGGTWSQPQPTNIRSGACPRLMRLRDGRLVLTFGRRFEPCGIRAAISDDDGETWRDDQLLLRRGPNGDLGYTSTIELDDGRLLTATYMQKRGVTGIIGTYWQPSR